jgi:hypothetical protein
MTIYRQLSKRSKADHHTATSYKAKLTAGVVQTALTKLQTASDALKNTSAIATKGIQH